MNKKYFSFLIIFQFLICFSIIYSQPSAKEILEKSVKAHGGMDKLTKWKSLITTGEIILDQSDAIKMRGALTRYIVKPDKVRIEQDFTAFEPHRIVRSYIYNNSQAWAIVNLVPYYSNQYISSLKATLDKSDGVAYFLTKSQTLELKPDRIIEGKPVYVIESIQANDTTFLFIDKKNYFLISDSTKNIKMIYSTFKKFNGVFYSTAYNQIIHTPQRVYIHKFKLQKVQYNVSIDPNLFEEERPKKNEKK